MNVTHCSIITFSVCFLLPSLLTSLSTCAFPLSLILTWHNFTQKFKSEDGDSDDEDDDDDVSTIPNMKSVDVSAGKIHTVDEASDPSGETVFTWHFKPISRSIGFSVEWIPLSDDVGDYKGDDMSPEGTRTPPPTPVTPAPKSPSTSTSTSTSSTMKSPVVVMPLKICGNKRAIKGSFTAKGSGVCRFSFSNKHSWWFSKEVTYLVQGSAAPKGAAASAADGGIALHSDAATLIRDHVDATDD